MTGDGGNDVSMIQAADTGVGIVGKEGKQASLAADFSVNQFSHIGKLLIVHGRNRLVIHGHMLMNIHVYTNYYICTIHKSIKQIIWSWYILTTITLHYNNWTTLLSMMKMIVSVTYMGYAVH